jgi:hypothetical protein
LLSFLLLFVAATLWTGRWIGWALGTAVFGLNTVLGVVQHLMLATAAADTVTLAVDVVGFVYLLAIRDRFGTSDDDRSVPETPHRR